MSKLTFPKKLHAILSSPEFGGTIEWLPNGLSWQILKPKKFENEVIPRHFNHSQIASFMRQVNGWGFRRIIDEHEIVSYSHRYFVRDFPELCKYMRRTGRKHLETCKHYVSVVPEAPKSHETLPEENADECKKTALISRNAYLLSRNRAILENTRATVDDEQMRTQKSASERQYAMMNRQLAELRALTMQRSSLVKYQQEDLQQYTRVLRASDLCYDPSRQYIGYHHPDVRSMSICPATIKHHLEQQINSMSKELLLIQELKTRFIGSLP